MLNKNNLSRIRRSLNVSQMQVAVNSGVSSATIIGIEKYGYYPGPGVRERLSKALGVTENEIWPK